MTTWQKVRVTFTDADNNEVSAVMYEDQDGDFWNGPSSGALLCVSLLRGGYKIEEIRELPTGVGSVIRVSDYGDYFENKYGDLRDVYTTDASGQWWSNTDGDVISCESIKHYDWQYEILSEGIQL